MSVEQEPLKCPRCDSLDTKFCYYNNYSTAQPRHFCKNCKRYWTAGGSLRNVPVGGGLRKNKKSKQAQAKQGGAISPSSNSAPDEQHQQPFHGERGSRPLTRSASVSHSLAHHSSDAFPYDTTPPPSLPPVTSLPLTSPSSSAEDETLAKSRSDSVFAYADLNYLEPPSDAYYGNNYSLHLPLRNHVNSLYTYNNYVHHLDASSSLQQQQQEQQQQQQQQQEQIYGSFKRQRGMGDTSSSLQAQAGEIPGTSQEPGKGRIYGFGYAGVDGHHHQNHQQHQEQWYQGLGGPPPTQTTTGHDGDRLQASANGERSLVGGGNEKRRAEEDDDDGLDNVVNVRYPYDWEQVSEVLFGGTPDFFQMPGF